MHEKQTHWEETFEDESYRRLDGEKKSRGFRATAEESEEFLRTDVFGYPWCLDWEERGGGFGETAEESEGFLQVTFWLPLVP